MWGTPQRQVAFGGAYNIVAGYFCLALYNIEGYEEKEIVNRCVSKTPSCNSKSALAKTRKNTESCKSAG